jgi:hypothetical protein
MRRAGFLCVLATTLLAAQAARATESERDIQVASLPRVQIHLIESRATTRKTSLLLIPGWRMTAAISRDQRRAAKPTDQGQARPSWAHGYTDATLMSAAPP